MKVLPFLFTTALITACSSQPSVKSPSAVELVPDLEKQTVALYTLEGTSPRCTGVWVGPHKILTAAHCVSHDDLDPLFYSTYDEHIGAFQAPAKLHSMALSKEDERKDLASYITGQFDTPQHVTAIIALSLPPVGSPVHSIGHTRGLTWSYKTGAVASYREKAFLPVEDEKEGPWLQAFLPVNKGDSGGALFNDRGEVCGITSFMATMVPLSAFYVTSGTIREFLK